MNFEGIDLNKIYETAIGLASNYVPKVFLALVVLIIGSMIIGKLVRVIEFGLKKNQIDQSLSQFLSSLVKWILKALLLISVASMVGIATTSFVALLGAGGLAIGMSLQGSLANFAGGVLILLFKPFKVGDYILAQGQEGFVKKIDVFATILTKLDNQRVILPNGPLSSGTIVNVGAEENRRVDLSIGIGYGDNIKVAIDALKAMCLQHPKVLKTPEPFIGVTEYGDSSVNLTIRSWCKTPDYWDVFFELNESIKTTLEASQISIPYPQRDIHIQKGSLN